MALITEVSLRRRFRASLFSMVAVCAESVRLDMDKWLPKSIDVCAHSRLIHQALA